MHYTGQHLIWLVGSLSRVFRLPFDAQLIRQQFPPPYSRTALLNALQALDFKVGELHLSDTGTAELARIPYPVVAFVRVAEQAEPAVPSDEIAPPDPTIPVLLIKADTERVLFFRPNAEQPKTILLTEFTQHFRSDILLVAR